jgi:hypothetical protein
MNTYSVVEASLKTCHFNPFRMRTYKKSADNSFIMRTYKKPQGGGLSASPSHFKGYSARRASRVTMKPRVDNLGPEARDPVAIVEAR